METKEKATKSKKISAKSHLLGLGIAVAVLLGTGVLGGVTGVFDGVDGFVDMIHISKDVIVKLIIMLAFLIAANSILQLILGVFRGKLGRTGTLATVFASLVKYSVVLIGFCWGLTIIGVDVSTVFASVGIIALILGFGAESLVADLVTGVFILFENQFNVGDIIEIDGFRGTVDSIGIRTISIKDTGSNIKIINNSDLKNIINRSNQSSIAVSEVGVAYETDLEELEKKLPNILNDIKKRNEKLFKGTVDYLGVEELADSCVKLKFIAEVNEADFFKGRRVLNRELKCAFDKEHIVIAYPQLDVHTK